jgi:PilZ domain-containing protein
MSSGDAPSRRLERRWAPRYVFRAALEIEWGSALLRGQTRDISANGLFVESSDTLWVGAGFSARLALEQQHLKIDCAVRRVEPGLGMGVSVTLTEQPHQRRYQDLLRSLANPQA